MALSLLVSMRGHLLVFDHREKYVPVLSLSAAPVVDAMPSAPVTVLARVARASFPADRVNQRVQRLAMPVWDRSIDGCLAIRRSPDTTKGVGRALRAWCIAGLASRCDGVGLLDGRSRMQAIHDGVGI